MGEFHKLPGVLKEQWAVLSLFLNVKNAGTLRLRATQGEVEASLLDPNLVCSPIEVWTTSLSPSLSFSLSLSLQHHNDDHIHIHLFSQLASSFHVLCAVNKAAVACEQNQMKTRTIFSEIIYCLSPSSNVSSQCILYCDNYYNEACTYCTCFVRYYLDYFTYLTLQISFGQTGLDNWGY